MAEPIFRSGRPCGQEKFSSKRVHARVLAALDDLNPGVLAAFLHDGGDETPSGEPVLAPLEFVDPVRERPVADQLDVFPADHLAVRGVELGVARGDVDDLRGVEAHGLGDDRAPALPEGARDDVEVRPGGPEAMMKGFGSFRPSTVVASVGMC
jgi:hypothetical protein